MANPFDEFDVNPFDEFDSPKEKKKASIGTGIASSFANVGNFADTAISTLAGSAAALFGQEKDAVQIEEEMRARNKARNEWANPNQEEIGFGGKLAGTVATLPMQVLGMGLSPASTVDTALQAGETNTDALKAGAIDAAGNAIGIAIPGWKEGSALVRGLTGFGVNAAQDAGTKAIIQSQLKTEKGKASFEPTWEDAAVSGVTGGAMGFAFGNKGQKKVESKVKQMIAEQEAKTPVVEAPKPSVDMRDTDLAGYDQVLREPGSINPYDVGGHVSKAQEGVETIVDPEAQRSLFDQEIKPEEGPYMDQARQAEVEAAKAAEAQQVINERQAALEQEVQAARVKDETITDVAHRQMGPEDSVVTREAPLFGANRDGIIELNSGLRPDWNKLFSKDKLENTLATSEDGTYIPNNPNTNVAIEKALEQGKDGKQWNMVQSGSTSVAMKTGSPIIKAASEIVQNGLKRADLLIRNSVFPAEQSLKKLSKQDIVDLGEVFKAEMTNGKRFDADVLTRNMSVKQIQAYTDMRRLFDDALDSMNAARLAKGLDPVKPMEAYMASRWQGDFRRPVYEKTKDGQKLVWYLASNSKIGLESQTKALLKDFPDLVIDPKKDHVVRSSNSKTELESMYTKMLDILGRDDPAVQKIAQAVAEQKVAQGADMLGQQKHFESKAGIRGFVGDRPGSNPRAEAIAMFQQQIQYAKNAYRWSEMQKAADDIKTIVSDPRLQELQPNNVKYIREYFKNAVGMGEGKAARLLDDALRDGLNVSPTLLNNAVGDVKSFFIMQKLAASAGYTLANLIQTSNVLPYLSQMAGAGYRGNPVSAVLNGTVQGMAMGAWHHARALGVDLPFPDSFTKEAFKYAEDNGVIARSVYDESPISANFGIVGGAANLAAKTMTVPESFVRSVAFMTYANMLKSSGKIKDPSKMFQMAEEYVNKSMVDYRETERPLMFSKAGAVGNFANTLQTYPISFYNQYAYMAKQAIEGNPWGLGAMLAVHYGVAGAMGIPGFDDAEKLYKWLRDNALPTDTWAEVMKSPFMSDPKLWMMENMGNASVYGALSDKSGIGLTSRVAAPGAGAMLQSPAGPITDIAGQVANVAKLAVDPLNKEKQAQVAMSSLPVGLQGLLETQDFMKDYTFVERPDGTKVFMKTKDIADRKGGYARTPEEVKMRAFGLRSQKEVVERDVSYATTSALQTAAKKSGELIDRYYSAIRRGDTQKAKELGKLYVDLTGKEIQDRDMENQIKEEFMTDVERSKSAVETVRKAQAIARMNKLLGQ